MKRKLTIAERFKGFIWTGETRVVATSGTGLSVSNLKGEWKFEAQGGRIVKNQWNVISSHNSEAEAIKAMTKWNKGMKG